MKLNTKGLQGQIKKSALVYSNDPKQPSVKLILTTNVRVPIAIQPRGVFIEGFAGDDIQSAVTIEGQKDKPLELTFVSNSLPKKVAYEIKEVTKGKTYQLVLKNIGKKEDKYSGFITFKTNYPEKPELMIRYLGFVKKPGEDDQKNHSQLNKKSISDRTKIKNKTPVAVLVDE